MELRNKVNILLVDDQPARLLTYQTVLSELGQNLVTARSGVEALEKLMRDEFAVVLLDVSMPDMDGFETAHLIHTHPRYERTPIIFVTGVHVTELDRLNGYKLGAVDYVSIPVVPEILRSKVAVLVELYCKRRELRELNTSLTAANARLAQANLALQEEKARELEGLNATLKDADRKKDEFLALLAHELRNPLAPLANAVELMRRQPCDPPTRWAREVIERQVGYLTRLVDDLLDVSRITRGQITLNRQPLELRSIVERAIEMVQPLLEQRRQQIRVTNQDPTALVSGDQVRLVQAFGNVLGNAVKYTGDEGHIEVSLQCRDGYAEVRIRDDGIGIPVDRLTAIFELFARSTSTSEHAHSGLGIGLALVRRLVEMHGGSVTAHSEGRGLGSEFVIRLPLAVEGAYARTGDAAHPAAADLVRRRILIADDNVDALESTTSLLELDGHEIFGASDGALAFAAAQRHRPEVILLDVGMPVLDGYEVARRIRAEPWGREVTLVAVTGWGQETDRRRSQEAGFDWHLVKPVELGRLSALLASLPARTAARAHGPPAPDTAATSDAHGL